MDRPQWTSFLDLRTLLNSFRPSTDCYFARRLNFSLISFAIVPRLSDNPSIEDISAWNNSDPKEYKVRILNFKHPDIDNAIHPIINEENLTWRFLDGANVKFRESFRPRARSLYFHFCLQIIRLSWGYQQKDTETLKKELGRVFWGIRGRCLSRNMLQAFNDDLGYEHKLLWKER